MVIEISDVNFGHESTRSLLMDPISKLLYKATVEFRDQVIYLIWWKDDKTKKEFRRVAVAPYSSAQLRPSP